MAISITAEVADVLTRSACVGKVVKLPADQLDRSLYMSVDKVLKALGGKWDRKTGGHAFPFDPAPKLSEALGNGKVVSRQQKLQHFDTPTDLAARACQMAEITADDTCLEPSAGVGRIVAAMAAHRPKRIVAVEIDADNAVAVEALGLDVGIIVGDFLAQQPSDYSHVTVVVMNPPFSGNQDVRHVRHAFSCLAPGGRLVSILSEHAFTGQEKECAAFRDWLASLGAHVEDVPAGAFKESGTQVSSRLIVVHKPLA